MINNNLNFNGQWFYKGTPDKKSGPKIDCMFLENVIEQLDTVQNFKYKKLDNDKVELNLKNCDVVYDSDSIVIDYKMDDATLKIDKSDYTNNFHDPDNHVKKTFDDFKKRASEFIELFNKFYR